MDNFLAHEALDRTFMLMTTFNDFICNHQFIQNNPEFEKQADEIVDKMSALYRAIAAKRFEEDSLD